MQDLIGENRQQCGRAPEQHREQIERNRCQDHLLAKHESQSSDQTFPGAFLNLISGLRAATDRQNQNEKQKCTQSVQCVNKREPDVRNQQAADCRPDNCSNLKNAIVPSHRVRKRIARNERREKRAARRPTECARRSSDEKKQINQRN